MRLPRPGHQREPAPMVSCVTISASRSSNSGEPTGYQQAKTWSGPDAGVSGGSWWLHFSRAYAHRGANLQPGGGFTRSGGRPGIAIRRVWLGSSILGILRINDLVYGIFM